MRNKLLGTFIAVVLVTFCIAGCQNETVTNEVEKIVYRDRTVDITVPVIPPVNPGAKITSLQAAISLAKPGDVIDLDDELYSGITTIEPSIAVTKAVTIKNFSDLGGASLKVVSDGVVLSNIGKASVTTNSSLKISGSSLSSLSIASIDDLGRGEFVKPRPPRVELLSSDVSSDITIALDNAALTIHDVSADNVKFNADNTQLTVEDSSSVINRFETDKDCKVVLEDGTSDTIPCVLEKMDIGAHGKLTQVNMQAAESLILTKLSPESGLITTMKEDESIDFSHLEVIGTYMATGAVTVFTAKLTYDLQSTFTKLEKDFSIKIDGSLAYKRENGEPVDTGYDWSSLEAGYHNVVIEKNDFPDKAQDYAYETMLTVYEKEINPVLVRIETDTTYAHTEYLADETLDLSDLIVRGVYEVNSVFAGTTSYTEEISNYTQDTSNGTVLTANKNVVVSYQGKNATVSITVIPSCVVTLHYGYKTESFLIAKGTKVKEPFVDDRLGYTHVAGEWREEDNHNPGHFYTHPLETWHTISNPENNSMAYTFSNGYSDSSVTEDLELYLVGSWTKLKPGIGKIVYLDKTTADNENDKYIYVANPISGETAVGVVFVNMSDLGGDDGYRIVSFTESNNLLWCSNNSDVVKNNKDITSDENGSGRLTSLKDGSINWNRICSNVTDENTSGHYPAFEYVNGLQSDDSDYPWYMPSRAELLNLTVHGGDALNGVFENLNITKIDTVNNIYWSSSGAGQKEFGQGVYCSAKTDQDGIVLGRLDYDNGGVYEGVYSVPINFATYYAYYTSVITAAKVRAIRKFKYQSSTTGDNRYTY